MTAEPLEPMDRIQKRLAESGDALFGPEADADAASLVAAARQPGADGRQLVHFPAVRLLAYFYLARHNSGPDPGYDNLGSGTRWMMMVAAVQPDSVPEDFHAQVSSMHRRGMELADEAQESYIAYKSGNDIEKLDTAISQYWAAMNLTAAPGPGQTMVLAQLSNALTTRFQDHNDPGALDLAITLRLQAIERTPADDPRRVLRVSLLADQYLHRFESAGNEPDLDAAIDASHQALDATPAEDDHTTLRSARQARLLFLKFASTQDPAQLDDAIRLVRHGIASATQQDEPDMGAYVGELATYLLERFDRRGDVADLDAAVAGRRRILDGAEGDIRLTRLSLLGNLLSDRYERTGDRAALDEAVELDRVALTETPAHHAMRDARLANLSTALRLRYQLLGNLPDLDEAIELGRETLREPGSRSNVLALASLSAALLLRFWHRFERDDLAEGLAMAERAVEQGDSDDPHWPLALTVRAQAHLVHLAELDEEPDIDEVTEWHREAVAVVPRHDPDRVLLLTNLGTHLMSQYRDDDDPAGPEMLDQALAVLQEALDTSTERHPFRHMAVTSRAHALVARADRDHARSDLDDAVSSVRELTTSPDVPAVCWLELGNILEMRHRRRGGHRDLVEALDCWQRTTRATDASVDQRMRAADRWGRFAFVHGDADQSMRGYSVAMQLLPQIAWHGLTRSARQKHLIDWSGVVGSAATAALAAGHPARAVEVLEAGRAVVWNQLSRMRGDLSSIDEAAPDLARRLRELRDVLDAPGIADDDEPRLFGATHSTARAIRERRLQDRIRLTDQWDALVAEAHEVPGLRRVFEPTPFAELAGAAAEGPVVLVNISALGCHALILRSPDAGVDVVELATLSLRSVMERAVGFLNVLLRAQLPNQPFIERERDRHEVLDLLEWMWDEICVPVFDRLGLTEESSSPPRLWWCPTNMLALLPLHAAGRYPRHANDDMSTRGEAVADRIVPSYTPTLAALCRSRERAPHRGPLRQLVVGMPTTPDRSPLPAVTQELAVLEEYFAPLARNHLVGPEATRDAVRQALAEYPWVHFACHADQDLMNPDAGSFALADGPLRVMALAELKLPDLELAYLSACETATGGAQLPDEAVHLAAAMHLLGYRHVLATMWHIADNSAPTVAADVYEHLMKSPTPSAGNAAEALHRAVAALRAAHPTDPLRWAPYVHLGP